MDLNTVCFLLFAFLFAGFLVLEGFDYGVAMLLPFVAGTDPERQAVLATLAPVWEGNEIWLIAAGTVLFAAFPPVYAALFSGLYLAFLLLLAALILRGVAFELRRAGGPRWRSCWDRAVFAGGALPALLAGVAVAALLAGLPLNAAGQYAGPLAGPLSPCSLAGGLAYAALSLLHGAAYLTLRLEPRLARRARKAGLTLGGWVLGAVGFFAFLALTATDLAARPAAGVLLLAAVAAVALCRRRLAQRRFAAAFAASSAAVLALAGAVFAGLYPRLLVSSLDPRWSLDIHNAAANPLTLKTVAVAAVVILPAVLALEAWKYYVFRQPVTVAPALAPERRRLWTGLRRLLLVQACRARRLLADLAALAGELRRK